ncbi:hypothetical protein [Duganella vulcania]|uniref:Uncharacterized protein n=1 Tax=Duganella vulcania TaxID=2692166 RepID=A0A845GXL0_9BURK|nr:hypothetical protein [Duganella vulcania]MYM99004.1 hypothetical protein [Duganella vulcania]
MPSIPERRLEEEVIVATAVVSANRVSPQGFFAGSQQRRPVRRAWKKYFQNDGTAPRAAPLMVTGGAAYARRDVDGPGFSSCVLD